MTNAELKTRWPDLGTLVTELRQIDQSGVADALVDAVRAGATSGEILDGIGVVLRKHRALRSVLSPPAAAAWDAIMADVDRAYPGSRIGHWFARLTRRVIWQAQRRMFQANTGILKTTFFTFSL